MSDLKNNEKVKVDRAFRRKTNYEKTKDFFDNLSKYIVLILTFPLTIIKGILKPIFDFMDDSMMTQRASIIIGIMLTLYVFNWIFGFVTNLPADRTGLDIAGIVGAILVPIAGLITILLRYGSAGRVNDADEEKTEKPPEKNKDI
jgi:uncharacterized membrane protein YGL010W